MTNPKTSSYESELISIIAHDLKSPVGATRGFIELVQQSGELNERQEYFIKRAMMSLSRMENLIASLLDYARLENGVALELGPVDLREVIDDVMIYLSEVARQNGVTVHIGILDGKSSIVADDQLLVHVMNNLISNAIKYNDDGGEVWVSVSNQRRSIRVDVRDNGMGIPEEAIPFIFDQFYRAHSETDKKGSGLGLAICKSIVELHGGHIWVESQVGVGSTFSFTLPVEPVSPQARKRQTSLFESAGEQDDPIDDNLQESHDSSETDSHHDAP